MNIKTTVIFYIGIVSVLRTEGINAIEPGNFAPPPFSHYEPILERMPFGEAPKNTEGEVDPDAAKEAAKLKIEQEKLARKINMSAVNVTPQGETAIGFTDLSEKPPRSYYLVVGDEAGGWTVKSANYEDESAEIEKDGVTINLKLGKGLVSDESKPGKEQAGKVPAKPVHVKAPAMIPPPSAIPAAAVTKKTTANAENIRERLKQLNSNVSSSENIRSYMERLRERKLQESTAMKQAEEDQRKQLEKLARDVASKEIKKRAAALAEEAALEKELALEEERLLKEQEEAAAKEEAEAAKEEPAL